MSSRSIGVIHVRDLVALVLEVLDPGDLERDVREVGSELVECAGGFHDDLRGAHELRQEALFPGEQLDHGPSVRGGG